MIVTKGHNRFYLKNWEYNACRIMTALATVVENNGGQVKPQNTAIISNRTLEDAKNKCLEHIAIIETKQQPNEKQLTFLKTQYDELEKLNAINNDPIEVTHTTYICFVLDDVYYYYQMDDNPFFEFYYSKTPVRNGKISRDAVMDQDPKEWLYDCFFSFHASDADIKEAANLIFNMLVAAKNSPIHRDKTRKRVPNTYDGGYHYETIYEPKRFEKLGEWYKEEKQNAKTIL